MKRHRAVAGMATPPKKKSRRPAASARKALEPPPTRPLDDKWTSKELDAALRAAGLPNSYRKKKANGSFFAKANWSTKAGKRAVLEDLARGPTERQTGRRPSSFARSDAAHAGRVSDDASLLATDGDGRAVCRWFATPLEGDQKSWCGRFSCVHRHLLTTQQAYVRACVVARDGGRCASCGVDAAAAYESAATVWLAAAARDRAAEDRAAAAARAVDDGPLRAWLERRLEKRGDTLPPEGHWYQADHVLGVADGGGVGTHSNVLSSFQTLCAPCHEDKTARARRDRADVVDLTTLEDEEAEEVVDLTGA